MSDQSTDPIPANQHLCQNCRSWQQLKNKDGSPNMLGKCFRHAPSPKEGMYNKAKVFFVRWPLTFAEEGCGEFHP